jgi:flagellar biosynthetic protein FliR
MGLSFAVFFDPQSTGQTPVISEFFGLLATLAFLAMNGHLLALSMLAESFTVFPVAIETLSAVGMGRLVTGAAMIFVIGLMISLPLVVSLLIANIGMGFLSRLAGFAVIGLSLPYIGAALETVFNQGFALMRAVMAR